MAVLLLLKGKFDNSIMKLYARAIKMPGEIDK